jgi:rSAM/selenodomain-associated transferase 2
MKPNQDGPPALVSIIIPTLNEAHALGQTLDMLAQLQGFFEIIVADGGSDDATVTIAQQRGTHVVPSRRGRGTQLHAGAGAAHGDVLWFLHADAHPAVDALDYIHEALRRPEVVGGHFQVRFDGRTRAARFLTWLYHHARRFGLCYGDSAIFVRRQVYKEIGGFRAFPLFEDLDLVSRVRRRGCFRCLPSRVIVSSRRFEGRQFLRAFTRWAALQVLYWFGVSPRALGRWYPDVRGRPVGTGPEEPVP